VVDEGLSAGRELAIDVLARQAGERFLDAGVGTAWAFVRVLAETGPSAAMGIDMAPGMITVARQRLVDAGIVGAPLALADLRRLPASDSAFDCIICTHTLDVLSLETSIVVLRELRRVLRPDGRLVTLTLCTGEGDDAAFSDDWLKRFARDPEYFGGARPVELRPLLETAGYEAVERWYSGHGKGWPAEVLRARPRQRS
jgi:ubiquinone/menaquinone biosynthesis C-methylase UbiE